MVLFTETGHLTKLAFSHVPAADAFVMAGMHESFKKLRKNIGIKDAANQVARIGWVAGLESFPAHPNCMVNRIGGRQVAVNVLWENGIIGGLRIVEILMKWGLEDYHGGSIAAIRHGNISALKLFREWGADEIDIERMLGIAALNGHVHGMRFARKCGASRITVAIGMACIGGNIRCLRILRKWLHGDLDVLYINRMLDNGAKAGHISVMRLAKQWGTNNFNNAALTACMGHVDPIIRTMRRETGRPPVTEQSVCDLLKLLRRWGATKFEPAFLFVHTNGMSNIVDLLSSWILAQ